MRRFSKTHNGKGPHGIIAMVHRSSSAPLPQFRRVALFCVLPRTFCFYGSFCSSGDGIRALCMTDKSSIGEPPLSSFCLVLIWSSIELWIELRPLHVLGECSSIIHILCPLFCFCLLFVFEMRFGHAIWAGFELTIPCFHL